MKTNQVCSIPTPHTIIPPWKTCDLKTALPFNGSLPIKGHNHATEPDICYGNHSYLTVPSRHGLPPPFPMKCHIHPRNVACNTAASKQGVQQTLHLMQHLCACSSNGALYTITINQYQLYVEVHNPILEDTKPIPYTRQMDFLHTHLSACNMQLHQASATMDPICMASTQQKHYGWCPCHYACNQLEMVNSIWMYLCFIMLSEITESNGLNIHQPVCNGSTTPFPSQLTWPYQPPPTKAMWQVWTQAISMMYAKSNNNPAVQQPLRPWLPETTHTYCTWQWLICPTTYILYHHSHEHQWIQYNPSHQL